jgi:hydroxymethylpyrimidine kinase/phosphomethylpyrimidine kinase
MKQKSRILIIAGFDPSGGAGIVADLETIHKLGARAAVSVTAVTIQNSKEFVKYTALQSEQLKQQLDVIFDEYKIVGVKIGMLGNRANAEVVSSILEKHKPPQTVLDPIYKSTTGEILNDDVAFAVIKDRIFPHTTVITPNKEEACYLLGKGSKDLPPAKIAVQLVDKYRLKSVIITGNESKNSIFDLVYDGENANLIQSKKAKVKNGHGTGCRHSSALTYYLSKGIFLNESALLAKDYVLDYLSSHH